MGKLTKSDMKQLIDSIIVLVDTREKKLPNHITDCFDRFGVKWERKKLNSGDYSAILPECLKLNTPEINLEDELCIERKMDATELISCVTSQRERFNREFNRSQADILILMEGSYSDIVEGRFRNKVTVKQALGSLEGFCNDNKTKCFYIDKKYSALWIWNVFKYRIKNKLKNI